MNLQGDEPLMNIDDIKNLNDKMKKKQSQLGTLASQIENKDFYENDNIVKVSTKEKLDNLNFPEAISFTRKIFKKTENTYHHLGIYCYQVETLKKFVSFNQSTNEINNKLEQLRAIDNDIKINVVFQNHLLLD